MSLQKIKNFFIKKEEKTLNDWVPEAYELADSKQGFIALYSEKNIAYLEEGLELEQKLVQPDYYKTAFHNNMFNYLKPDQKLSILIRLERELAKKEKRQEAGFVIGEYENGDFWCETKNGKSTYYINKTMLINVPSKQTVDEEDLNIIKQQIAEEYGEEAVNDFEYTEETETIMDSYSAINMMYYLNINALAQQSLHKQKTTGVLASEHRNLVINAQNMVKESQLYSMFLGSFALTEKQEKRVINYFCQPINQKMKGALELMKEIHFESTHSFMGLGIEDDTYEEYKIYFENKSRLEDELFDRYYKGKNKTEVYFDNINEEIKELY